MVDWRPGLLRSTFGNHEVSGRTLRPGGRLCVWRWSLNFFGGAAEMDRALPVSISNAAMEAAILWVGDHVTPMAERVFGDAACSEVDRGDLLAPPVTPRSCTQKPSE